MAKDVQKYGVVLRRGSRYRYKNVIYKRDVPALVEKEARDHLVEDAGFFVDILLDSKGLALRPKKVARKPRRKSSGVKVHTGPPLMDTGEESGLAAPQANTEGAQEA